MYGEDFYLDSFYEDRFELPYDYHDHPTDPPVNLWDEEDDDYDYDRDVDDSFPMYLEYEGPFGLSGYDEY